MENYALAWKKQMNFKQSAYDEFVEAFQKIPPSFFSQKVDGILGALVWKRGSLPYFVTVNNIKVTDLPVLYEYDKILRSIPNLDSAVVVGELVAMKAGTILPFPQTSSVVRTAYREENKPYIYHWLFDVYSLNGKRIKNYEEAVTFINNYFRKSSLKIRIPKIVRGDIRVFEKLFEETVSKQGFEGVVARLPNRNYKVKKSFTADLAVIGFGSTKMPAWRKKQISYLITAFIAKDRTYRVSSKVGSGFTESERSELFEYCNANNAGVFSEATGDFFVKPGLIVEVKFDRFRVKVTKAFSYSKGKYNFVGEKPSVSLDLPRFIRIRTDKRPTPYDVRLSQIPGWVGD